MIRRLGSIIALCVAASCTRASEAARHAPDVPDVPLSVEDVASGGRWQSGTSQGSYRVIGFAEGFEEVRHRVVVQWLQDATRDRSDSLVNTVDLNERGNVYGLASPAIVQQGSSWIVKVRSARMPMTQYDDSLTFTVGTPGIVSLVR